MRDIKSRQPFPHACRRLVLCAAMTLTGLGSMLAASPSGTLAGAQTAVPHNVIVEMFEWSWNSIARECTDVLGPDGYGAVQTSPPQAHYVDAAEGFPWWEQYQPVDYNLTSRLGDQAEFADMVDACHAAGVKVYADVLINNMSGFNGGPTSDGSSFAHFSYPTVPYTQSDFHSCTTTITDWDDASQVYDCEESGLADLNTELPYVRQMLANYMNFLISLGVDGFRFDSAKEVPDADIQAMEKLLTKRVFIFQDVLYGAGQPITPQMYTSTGLVADGQYQDAIGQIFQYGQLSTLDQFGTEPTWLPSNDVVVYTDDHDSERDGDTNILTFANGQLYNLANIFMLAYPYGVPKVMSSYYFDNYNQGPPMGSQGVAVPATCTTTTYVCEQRTPAIAGMVGFNNAAGSTPLDDWWTDGDNQIAFGRGDVGFVVINRESNSLTNTWQTGLPAGQYCDIIHGGLVEGSCTGPVLTVNGSGQLTATVEPMDAIAIDTSAMPTEPASAVTETVNVTVPVSTGATGETVYLAGNLSVLGNGQSDWAADGVPMTEVSPTQWTATIQAASATTLSYKYDLGGTWAGSEETASCGYQADRSLWVDGGTEDDIVDNWEGPSACGPAEAVIDVNVPPSTPATSTVYISGKFSALGTGIPASSNWQASLYPMDRVGPDEWEVIVPASADSTLSYRFDLDGTWSNVEDTAACSTAAASAFSFKAAGTIATATETVVAWAGVGACS